LFLNADAGFDSKEFRAICEQKEIIANIPRNPRNEKETESTSCQYFDEALYKRRYVIERANAWQDQFKALIIRYETRVDTWLNLLILSFTVIFIRRINKKINPKQLQCVFYSLSNNSAGLILNCNIFAVSLPPSPPFLCIVILPILKFPLLVISIFPFPK